MWWGLGPMLSSSTGSRYLRSQFPPRRTEVPTTWPCCSWPLEDSPCSWRPVGVSFGADTFNEQVVQGLLAASEVGA